MSCLLIPCIVNEQRVEYLFKSKLHSKCVTKVVASPVGPYYGSAVPATVVEDYDRAAPMGVGAVKCAGNYAADIVPAARAKKQGFPICLYLDAKEHRYVEEFSTSNFVAITKSNVYLTLRMPNLLFMFV